MSYSIIPTDNFSREAKQLAKKYRSFKTDLLQLKDDLIKNPLIGTSLGNNVYKIRLAIGSKSRGKAGGARVLSYVYVSGEKVFLLSVYDKSEKDTIPDHEIKAFINTLPLK